MNSLKARKFQQPKITTKQCSTEFYLTNQTPKPTTRESRRNQERHKTHEGAMAPRPTALTFPKLRNPEFPTLHSYAVPRFNVHEPEIPLVLFFAALMEPTNAT